MSALGPRLGIERLSNHRADRCNASSPAQTRAMAYGMSGQPATRSADLIQDLANFLLIRGPYSWLGWGWKGCSQHYYFPPEFNEVRTDFPLLRRWVWDRNLSSELAFVRAGLRRAVGAVQGDLGRQRGLHTRLLQGHRADGLQGLAGDHQDEVSTDNRTTGKCRRQSCPPLVPAKLVAAACTLGTATRGSRRLSEVFEMSSAGKRSNLIVDRDPTRLRPATARSGSAADMSAGGRYRLALLKPPTTAANSQRRALHPLPLPALPSATSGSVPDSWFCCKVRSVGGGPVPQITLSPKTKAAQPQGGPAARRRSPQGTKKKLPKASKRDAHRGRFGHLQRPGIEPGSLPWQGSILPLDQRCIPG